MCHKTPQACHDQSTPNNLMENGDKKKELKINLKMFLALTYQAEAVSVILELWRNKLTKATFNFQRLSDALNCYFLRKKPSTE